MMCFCFKQKTAYGWRISDWNSDVCSSDLPVSSFDPLPLLLFYAMGYEFGGAPFAVIEISIEALQRRSPTITVSRPRRLRLSVADIQLHIASGFHLRFLLFLLPSGDCLGRSCGYKHIRLPGN